ncbi:MAG: hypothetical protein AAFU68_14565 [Pseudomonadota bacterium]
MEGFLAIGFLVGMSHALEADHVAAVGAMAADPKAGRGRRNLVLRGAAWGLGHTITLFALCTLVILFGVALTDATSAALEFGVGVMLVLLGIDVLRRTRARRACTFTCMTMAMANRIFTRTAITARRNLIHPISMTTNIPAGFQFVRCSWASCTAPQARPGCSRSRSRPPRIPLSQSAMSRFLALARSPAWRR